MKRSDFLKKLGIGLGVAVVAPRVLADKTVEVDTSRYIIGIDPYKDDAPLQRRDLKKYPLTYDECYPSYYNIGDEFWNNGEKFLCIAILPVYKDSYRLTLRPFNPGKDIEVLSDNLGYYHFTGKSYWMDKEA